MAAFPKRPSSSQTPSTTFPDTALLNSEGDTIKARQTLIGGTGKYAGITGEVDVVRRMYRPPADGEGIGSAKLTGTYKLP